MADKSFQISSPTKKKKSEPRDGSPRTPHRELDHHIGTPGSLLDFNNMTPFPMTPFLMVSPGAAIGSTKVPSSREWATSFDPQTQCTTFSANVFNNHDLTPPMSHFGASRHKRKDDDVMSPLLDLNEPDTFLDHTSQSLLNANKEHLVKRIGRVTAPISLLESTIPESKVKLQSNMNESSSSLIHAVKAEPTTERKPASSVGAQMSSPPLKSTVVSSASSKLSSSTTFPSSSSSSNVGISSTFPDTSGLDAIINAAGADLEPSPDNIAKSIISEGGNKKGLSSSSKKLKVPHTILSLDHLSPPKPIMARDISPPSSVDPLLRLEMQASLIRAQAATKQEDNNKVINCNCKKSKCLKMYCDCFRLTEYCKQGCHCIDCNNLEQYESARQIAIKSIVERNPEAFKPRVTEDPKSNSKGHLTGCHCRKSQCLKKYCECFTGRVPCTSRCRCVDCKNGADLYSPDELARHRLLMGVQDSFGSAKKSDVSSSFVRTTSPSGGTRLFEGQRVPGSSSSQQKATIELEGSKKGRVEENLKSPAYNSLKSPDLSLYSAKFGGQYREQPASVRSEHSVNLLQTVDESPERIGVESLLSPTSESQILTSMKEEVVIRDNRNESRLSVPTSPIRTISSPQYVPSPMRLLELASVCEERQEQEFTSRSQSEAHSRSGSVS